jgi:hypothetical protein
MLSNLDDLDEEDVGMDISLFLVKNHSLTAVAKRNEV